jgi:FlaA1/EpsC-like NDP-sugar epimerase
MNRLLWKSAPRLKKQKLLLVALDALLLSGAYLLAFWLRLGGEQALSYSETIVRTFPIVLTVSLLMHAMQGLFSGILRYTSIETALAVFKSVTFSVLASCLILFLLFRLEGVPRSVFAIYWMASMLLIGGSRLSGRLLHKRPQQAVSDSKRVVLYGAGDTAELVLRGLKQTPSIGYEVAGLIDDDQRKEGREIHGVKIHATLDALGRVARTARVEEIWVCVPNMAGDKLRRICTTANQMKIRVRILPRLSHALLGQDLERFQKPNIADLLRRPPRRLDKERMRQWIRGRRVLITGAGGSIGSELARHVAKLEPKLLALCDASECNLFQVQQELAQLKGPSEKASYLVDIRHVSSVQRMFKDVQPDVVFCAAAYKHVPLVELHPCEGVLNNVQGLCNVALASAEQGAGEFVFISTDKAVRPACVMGATKRLGETIIQVLDRQTKTKFCAVRFGNVLGSSGSVVPIFQEQIRSGGPVTVTHVDMERYFMLASEAVELVIQAGSICKGSEVFVLDMGAPLRIADMARNLIRLMGKEPDVDIRLEYTGLRPGEKLTEELLIGKRDLSTAFEDIWIDAAPPPEVSWSTLRAQLRNLFELSTRGDRVGTLGMLKRLEPQFRAVYKETQDALFLAEQQLSSDPATRGVAQPAHDDDPFFPVRTSSLS